MARPVVTTDEVSTTFPNEAVLGNPGGRDSWLNWDSLIPDLDAVFALLFFSIAVQDDSILNGLLGCLYKIKRENTYRKI